MRLPSFCALLLLAAVLTACNSAEQQKPPVATTKNPASVPTPGDGVRRVTVQETAELVAKGQAVIVDVRAYGAYFQEHIKGSISIPNNEIFNRLDQLPHDKLIVTYCA
jgi:hypothetical protein